MMPSAIRSIPFAKPWITDAERQAVAKVLEGPILAHGPQSKAFEEEFAAFLGPGAHCVSVSSGMAALHLAYLDLGIGPGDEVIVPAQTHTATAHAVELVGAKPVFVDCDPATGNLTADRIAPAITPRTRAISVVHFLGIPCAMAEIAALAARHGLKVIEDCALALGARYQGTHVGLFGDAACFSFYPVKHITTGEGGMFVTRHPELAASVRLIRGFGVDRSYQERSIPGMYDVPGIGLNYRMSEVAAALGRPQLKRLEENLARRRENFLQLREGLALLPDLRIIGGKTDGTEVGYYCMSVLFGGVLGARRDEIVVALNAAGVGTSIYYPHPVPRMSYYRTKYGYPSAGFPNAEAISDSSIALPIGPHIGSSDVRYMIDVLTPIIRKISA